MARGWLHMRLAGWMLAAGDARAAPWARRRRAPPSAPWTRVVPWAIYAVVILDVAVLGRLAKHARQRCTGLLLLPQATAKFQSAKGFWLAWWLILSIFPVLFSVCFSLVTV